MHTPCKQFRHFKYQDTDLLNPTQLIVDHVTGSCRPKMHTGGGGEGGTSYTPLKDFGKFGNKNAIKHDNRV